MKKSLVLTIFLIFFCSSFVFAKVVKTYYPNKRLQSVIGYNKKGQYDGVYKLYWLNGNLKETARYRNGNFIPGTVKHYSVNGVLVK